MSIPTNCEGCAHHRPFARAYAQEKCCHFLLDTGRRREMNGDICLSRSETQKPKKDAFEIPTPQK